MAIHAPVLMMTRKAASHFLISFRAGSGRCWEDNKIQIIESPLKEKYSKQRTIINGRAKAITGDVQSSENRQEIIAIITQIKGILLQYSKDAALESIRQSNWAPPTGTSFDPSIIPPVAD